RANPNRLVRIFLAEAAVIPALGGLAGLGFGAAMLLMFARSLGFYFALLGVPFSWPPAAVLQAGAVLAVVFSAVLGLIGAFLPAWRGGGGGAPPPGSGGGGGGGAARAGAGPDPPGARPATPPVPHH